MRAPSFVLLVRCSGPIGVCSPVCPLCVLCCACRIMAHFSPVHRCARSVCCVACPVSWASWLLFTSVLTRCAELGVRCPGPLSSCLPVCPLGALLRVCGVLGHLAPVHRCAIVVCCGASAVSLATWLLFTGAPARCVALLVRCPQPFGSCSPVCPLGVLLCACGVLGHLPPVHRCARSVLCFACAVSWATWLLLTGVPALCVVLRMRRPGPLNSCSPVCLLGVSCCLCGVLGDLAPVYWCACSFLAFLVRCPGPLGSCSPVCPLCVLCCARGVLGLLAPVHRCVRSVCFVSCTVSWAPWLLFTGVLARCAVLGVRCPGPIGSCSLVCSLRVLCCVLRVRCCMRGALLQGADSSIRTAAVRSRQGLGTLQARTRPSGGRLFCSQQGLGTLPEAHLSVRTAAIRSQQGLGTLRARTCLSRQRLFCSRHWLGSLSGGVQTAAGVAWHLFLCCGSLRAVRALRLCSTRWPLLLGTCPCAFIVAGSVPPWPASWPRAVRRASSCLIALGASGRLCRRGRAFAHPGGLPPGLYWVGARGTRRPAENRAYCACRWPTPRQGRWARPASYPFGAQR